MRSLNEKHHFFILYIAIGCIVDIIGRILVIHHEFDLSRAVSNFYVLAESICFLVLFRNWCVIKKAYSFILVTTILFAIWIFDNIIINTVYDINSIFSVSYSLITVLFSTRLFHNVYVNASKNYFKDALIIISGTLIINYSYRAVFESVYLFKLNFSNNFYFSAFLIFIILNVFSNCTFTYAIHCMSLRKRLTLYY